MAALGSIGSAIVLVSLKVFLAVATGSLGVLRIAVLTRGKGELDSRWIFDKVFVRKPGDFLALGILYPATNQITSPNQMLAGLNAELPKDGVRVSGWELLGPTMAELVMNDLPVVFIPILALVVLTLWLAFRSWQEVLLSLVTQMFSFLLLAIVMSLADWKWNMMNLMALPLLLGMGVDFAIHTQLALHRYGGNSEAVRGSIGKALLLAGSTTVAGFAAIAFSSNAGMASLGRVCGVGISCALITAVFFLPVWWQRWIETGRLSAAAARSGNA